MASEATERQRRSYAEYARAGARAPAQFSSVMKCVPVLRVLLCGCGLMLLRSVAAWDLRSIGIDQFAVRHVSLYRNRAFLAIESASTNGK